MTEQMNLDKSPRANNEQTLKELTKIDIRRTLEAGVELAVVSVTDLSMIQTAISELHLFISRFSNQPTLEQYERESYEVQLDRRTLDQLDERQVKDIWGMFHPGDKK
ncbi:hypothetical protein EHF33_16360 (plasmid) [Deinococcus psychrotolerans]|uniref:Uncharacterized protein n=1 Tax=Deinococcus psychrotolerans TaxID=2489213 RepID=A0A3G8YGR4_9DEIO|nr:hypothetical protein [Deinococcus psychrotolerans]AZI44488.1 hypothetical protein EHF33_16360 [Deinococcus psychrotolerans]